MRYIIIGLLPPASAAIPNRRRDNGRGEQDSTLGCMPSNYLMIRFKYAMVLWLYGYVKFMYVPR
jgi:hypothetical protein